MIEHNGIHLGASIVRIIAPYARTLGERAAIDRLADSRGSVNDLALARLFLVAAGHAALARDVIDWITDADPSGRRDR